MCGNMHALAGCVQASRFESVLIRRMPYFEVKSSNLAYGDGDPSKEEDISEDKTADTYHKMEDIYLDGEEGNNPTYLFIASLSLSLSLSLCIYIYICNEIFLQTCIHKATTH